MSTQEQLSPSSSVLGFPHERVELFWLAVDFNGLVMDWIPPRRGDNALRSQLGRATARVSLSIANAANGTDHRAAAQLAEARKSLAKTAVLLSAMARQGRIPLATYGEARRRISQLLRGLDRLAEQPVAEWPTVAADIPCEPSERPDEAVERVRVMLGIETVASKVPVMVDAAEESEPPH
jgi:hypothetical protein